MEAKDLVAELIALPDQGARLAYLQQNSPPLSSQQVESAVRFLKSTYREHLRSDNQRALQTVDLIIDLATFAQNDAFLALGYRTKASVYTIGLGQYQDALDLYEQAEAIYQASNNELELARMQIVRVWALSFTDGYDEAVQWGEYACSVLEKQGDLQSWAILVNNLAMVHNRFGALHASLRLLNRAGDTFQQIGGEVRQYLPNNMANRVFVLTLLGQYNAAIEIAHAGLALAEEMGQSIVYARIQHNLGLTYYILGHYNRALHLFDQAQVVRLADKRYHKYVQGELTMTYCLLQLCRFADVVDRCQQVRQFCQEHNVTPETPFSLLNEAKAYASLGQFQKALDSLDQTHEWMTAAGDEGLLNTAETHLVRAELLYRQRKWAQARETAALCAQVFSEMERLLEAAQAHLLVARAAFAMGNLADAQHFAQEALAIAKPRHISALIYEGYAILGQSAQATARHDVAFDYYEQAIAALRHIRGRVMLEFRASFLEDRDKRRLYETMVDLCLSSENIRRALDYVEEAKSRALMDLIAHRLDLHVEARTSDDEALVLELNRQSDRRNALWRDLFSESNPPQDRLTQLHETEQRVTDLRNKLLIRNADYARDLSLTETYVEPAQPYLTDDTLLIEYFSLRDHLVAFCVTSRSPTPRVYHLPITLSQVKRRQQHLRVNFKTVPHSTVAQMAQLTHNAQTVLRGLYRDLLAPLLTDLTAFERVIVVPHDSLHYLPFHALFDGERYVIETHRVSYLPASSLLCHRQSLECTGRGMLAVGYSCQQKLPHAVFEAESLGKNWSADLLCEENATRERVQALMADRRIIHLATHGEFHHDNPLFSGLSLADGQLTTYDVFNLNLSASLVTLSGCYTGQSVVAGGDELLGLTRAFLAAGATTLVLSQWAAEDRATALLMAHFYQQLFGGASKAAALQKAQRSLLSARPDDKERPPWQHPFFWAPFYLVGDGGQL